MVGASQNGVQMRVGRCTSGVAAYPGDASHPQSDRAARLCCQFGAGAGMAWSPLGHVRRRRSATPLRMVPGIVIAQFPRLINPLVLISGVVSAGDLKDPDQQGVAAHGQQNKINEKIGNHAVQHQRVSLVRLCAKPKRRTSLTRLPSRPPRWWAGLDGTSLAQWKFRDIPFGCCYGRPRTPLLTLTRPKSTLGVVHHTES